jgi:hypothetical protein
MHKLARLRDERTRRLYVSRWRRMTRWEFWPAWIVYLPLVPYLAWLAIRNRGLTSFTAANPAIPAGGIVGDSKTAILGLLPPEVVPRTEVVPSAEAAAQFGFPVVLKPDSGQRGSGVVIARSIEDARAYFEKIRGPVMCQEYVEGPEFGIFYARYPNETRGRIISVTEKRLLSVTGDGKRTLESLMLRDPRAVCMARFHLHKHATRLSLIPAEGEMVQVVEIATHRRGAMFLDGSWVLTPALEEAIDRISRASEGFYFGRYDVRASSIEELQEGRFQVLELNGVNSEATHIYDPRLGIFAAYRALFRQWRLAFEIGAMNRRRGAKATKLRDLWRRYREYRRLATSHPD